MSQLAKLQQTFQDYVLEPEASVSNSWVSAEGKAAPETQLSIYSYAYKARLIEVLMNDYPAVVIAIGEEYFDELASSYIKPHPSTFFSLRDFGAGLPNFIVSLTQQETIWKEMPWLFELAVFEWSLGQSFDAADDAVFTQQDMVKVEPEAWPELKFKLHCSVQRLNFEWNIIEMWQALTAEIPTEVSAIKDVSTPVLVWRENLSSHFRSMNLDESVALDTLAQGDDFTDICESLVSLVDENEIPMHTASLLKTWINQGLISNIK